jgi:hypothetical protein
VEKKSLLKRRRQGRTFDGDLERNFNFDVYEFTGQVPML